MPETPDFDRLAQQMADRLFDTVDGGPTFKVHRGWYIDQLRLVWNARGAADAGLLRQALVVVEAHAENYPAARPLLAELRQYLQTTKG